MNELIGKKILSVSISHDEHILAFTTTQGVIAYETEAEEDQSETWFASVTNTNALLNATVQTVNEVDLKDNFNSTRQKRDNAYRFELLTDKGVTSITFKNSYPYSAGCLYLYEESLPNDMLEITSDWSS